MDEPEENDLKNNLKRMFEILKDEMRNYLKEMEEKQTKNWKISANHLKKTKEKNSNI